MSKVSTYTSACWRLYLHVVKFTTLTEAEFEDAFDKICHLLELANDERYRVTRKGEERGN